MSRKAMFGGGFRLEERAGVPGPACHDRLPHGDAGRRGRQHLDRHGQVSGLSVRARAQRGQEQRPDDEVGSAVDRDDGGIATPLLIGIRISQADEVRVRRAAVLRVAHAGDRRLEAVPLRECDPGRVVPRRHHPPRRRSIDRRLALSGEEILRRRRRIHVRAERQRARMRGDAPRRAGPDLGRVEPRTRALRHPGGMQMERDHLLQRYPRARRLRPAHDHHHGPKHRH